MKLVLSFPLGNSNPLSCSQLFLDLFPFPPQDEYFFKFPYNVSEMTGFVSSGTYGMNSVNQTKLLR